MSTTELDEVQSVLKHVLPDPSGYAQRLLRQAVTRWGQGAESPAGTFYTATIYPASPSEDPGYGSPETPAADEPPVDMNLLLAVALGACECWGLQAGCGRCAGRGAAGWTEPDPNLFEEFILPAAVRLSAATDGDPVPRRRRGTASANTYRTTQGENR
jgi:hypothetical protein